VPLTKELSASVPIPPYREQIAIDTFLLPEQPVEEKLAEAPPLTQELSSPVPNPPAAPKEEAVIALEPTSPQPPPEKTAEAPKEEVKPKVEEQPPVSVALVPAEAKTVERKPATAPSIAKADYYLQLGAFSNESQAKDVASGLPSSYPISIVGPESPSRPIFRIMLGPLNKAESGTLLYWFRDRGFPDAFIKTSR
jgi:cell division septation protein DedD